MNCKTMALQRTAVTEDGQVHLPVATFDVDGEIWHVCGRGMDAYILRPNRVDAGICVKLPPHESVPAMVADTLQSAIAFTLQPQETKKPKGDPAPDDKGESAGDPTPTDGTDGSAGDTDASSTSNPTPTQDFDSGAPNPDDKKGKGSATGESKKGSK